MRYRARSKKYFVNNLAKGWRGDSEGHRLAALGYRVKTPRDSSPQMQVDFERIQRDAPAPEVDVGSAVPQSSPDLAFIPGYRSGSGVVATPGVPPPPSSILDQSGGF